MSSSRELSFKTRHNFYLSGPSVDSTQWPQSDATCKSNLDVGLHNEFASAALTRKQFRSSINFPLNSNTDDHNIEYYKRYEHDELPVKESSFNNTRAGRGDKVSLTNSDLEKIEKKVFKTVSQELQLGDSSMRSLDSNIKFFKTTVQQIFDNFYTSMKDFELYKKRFNDILAKNKEDSIADMEDFITDMIRHIRSSEMTISTTSQKSTEMEFVDVKDKETNASGFSVVSSTETDTSAGGVIEAYKNENYLTDSTMDGNVAKVKGYANKEEIFNIYLNGLTPYVQIKMIERNLLSEINIKETVENITLGHNIASADNVTLAAKNLQLEQYVRQTQNHNIPDIEIPVKVSSAKKNIHLNEDFAPNDSFDANKSFMSKICNYLCRKLRKSSFG